MSGGRRGGKKYGHMADGGDSPKSDKQARREAGAGRAAQGMGSAGRAGGSKSAGGRAGREHAHRGGPSRSGGGGRR
jgi:hypothetical protein